MVFVTNVTCSEKCQNMSDVHSNVKMLKKFKNVKKCKLSKKFYDAEMVPKCCDAILPKCVQSNVKMFKKF